MTTVHTSLDRMAMTLAPGRWTRQALTASASVRLSVHLDRTDSAEAPAESLTASAVGGRPAHPVAETRRRRAMSRDRLARLSGISVDRLAEIENDPRAQTMTWAEAEGLAAALATRSSGLHESAWRHNRRAVGALATPDDIAPDWTPTTRTAGP